MVLITESKPIDFEQEMKQIKQNQEDYFKSITSGHCAICQVELLLDKRMLKMMDTATCSDCGEKGWDKIFQMGLLCGRELREWRKKHGR